MKILARAPRAVLLRTVAALDAWDLRVVGAAGGAAPTMPGLPPADGPVRLLYRAVDLRMRQDRLRSAWRPSPDSGGGGDTTSSRPHSAQRDQGRRSDQGQEQELSLPYQSRSDLLDQLQTALDEVGLTEDELKQRVAAGTATVVEADAWDEVDAARYLLEVEG